MKNFKDQINAINNINEIDDIIQDLDNRRFELTQEQAKQDKEKLKVLIGLCFIDENGNYCKITDVPTEQITSRNYIYDRSKFPIICIDVYTYEIHHKYIYGSSLANAIDPVKYFNSSYKTCTIEEFNSAVDQITNQIKG